MAADPSLVETGTIRYNDGVKPFVTVLAVLLIGALAAPAFAQQVKITAPPPPRERERGVISPGLHYETTRPPDADYYPQAPRVEHDPAFIAPVSVETETPTSTGRAGLSGWTSPNTPTGPTVAGAHNEVTGWFALGLSVTWGGPPRGKSTTAPAR